MDAFENEMNLDMNKVSTPTIERAYWRRKLPPAFRFYLEMVSRELIQTQPTNIYAHAAGFFEELLIQRDTELSLLPYEPYFEKLAGRQKKMYIAEPKKQEPKMQEPKKQDYPPVSIPGGRCNRCGRKLRPGQAGVENVPEGTNDARTARDSGQKNGQFQHVEGDRECKVIALTTTKDAFGRLLMRKGSKEENRLLNELASLVDY